MRMAECESGWVPGERARRRAAPKIKVGQEDAVRHSWQIVLCRRGGAVRLPDTPLLELEPSPFPRASIPHRSPRYAQSVRSQLQRYAQGHLHLHPRAELWISKLNEPSQLLDGKREHSRRLLTSLRYCRISFLSLSLSLSVCVSICSEREAAVYLTNSQICLLSSLIKELITKEEKSFRFFLSLNVDFWENFIFNKCNECFKHNPVVRIAFISINVHKI